MSHSSYAGDPKIMFAKYLGIEKGFTFAKGETFKNSIDCFDIHLAQVEAHD